MKVDPEGYQTHWHADEISDSVASSPDTAFIFHAWDRLVQLSAAEGNPGRVIDISCGNARDVTKLSQMGWEAVGMDPSVQQLQDAQKATKEAGEQVHLVRGVAEFLPFKEDVFDSLICKSALDHYVDRDQAMGECSRVVVPEGRAVVSANNYGGLTVRGSRLGYRLVRVLWPPARKMHFTWDSPVPWQHTYECTFANTRDLGKPHFDVVEQYGVSLLWGFPGWGRFLSLLPYAIRRLLLRGPHEIGRRLPQLADVCVFVWRPKPKSEPAT
ncbi:MAG: class I SAM-dependent methyltransferase [Chloroflexi bacterium]|nr:class I SAM-dependent methyltransferase [Chloroflexota bacterium]MCI0855103.1 class I SAM-dependent methyltransferase [Chloroflexota bacterium]MCI0889286.1 class I SAM-dependent methyltransferase [Chloroflexota bacterium]